MIRPKPLIEQIVRVQEDEPSRFYKARLDRCERTHPFTEAFVARVRARLDGEWIMTYPEPEPVYRRLAAFLKQPRNRLLLNSGSDQSIKAVFETYVGPGDKVLLHRPGYAMYPVYARMFGGEAVFQDHDADLRFDFEAYLARVGKGLRMAVLENPNGFIGAAPPVEVLRRFVEACEKAGALAVVDEAYFFFHDVTAADWLDAFENLVVVRTFSKALGAAGARVGYTLSREENIANLFKVKPMHEINGLAALVVDELLKDPAEFLAYVKETRGALNFLKEGLAALGIRTSDSVTNFLAAALGERLPGDEVSRRLRGEGILLRRPFREAHLGRWTRVGTGPMPAMRRLLEVVGAMIAEAGKGGARGAV